MEKFRIGDFVCYQSYDEWGLKSGIKWGEIIGIDSDVASIVLGGIDLNVLHYYKPNYMQPIRIRPRKDSDKVVKRKISSLSFANEINWGGPLW
jgi:hypothetical protein